MSMTTPEQIVEALERGDISGLPIIELQDAAERLRAFDVLSEKGYDVWHLEDSEDVCIGIPRRWGHGPIIQAPDLLTAIKEIET